MVKRVWPDAEMRNQTCIEFPNQFDRYNKQNYRAPDDAGVEMWYSLVNITYHIFPNLQTHLKDPLADGETLLGSGVAPVQQGGGTGQNGD